jgi:hypothetical protein
MAARAIFIGVASPDPLARRFHRATSFLLPFDYTGQRSLKILPRTSLPIHAALLIGLRVMIMRARQDDPSPPLCRDVA